MGLHIGFSNSMSSFDKPRGGCCPQPSTPAPPLPNPDPSRYKVLRWDEDHPGALIIEIEYLDCTNYEGRKVLLFLNVTLAQLLRQGKIDPHFSENTEHFSPTARFEPTEVGWNMARWLAARIGEI